MKMLKCPLCKGRQYFLYVVYNPKTKKHLYCCILCALKYGYKILGKYIEVISVQEEKQVEKEDKS